MRIFIGIKVEAPQELSLIDKSSTEEHNRWVKESNFHLTLVFIGQATETELQEISYGLKKLVKNHSCFTLKITGLGTFQKKKSSGVLWLNVEQSKALLNLQNEINLLVYETMPNLKPQHLKYKPHITIARFKKPGELEKYKVKLGNIPIHKTQRVTEVILYESVSTHEGVEYKVLEKFALK